MAKVRQAMDAAAIAVKNGVAHLPDASSSKELQAYLDGFGKLDGSANKILLSLTEGRLSTLPPEVQAALPNFWSPHAEIEAELNRSSRQPLGQIEGRPVGMRTCWEEGDPAVADFKDKLNALQDDLPPPDPAIACDLGKYGAATRDGKIFELDGKPVPVGPEQIRVFVTLRWRWLYSPLAQPHLIRLRNLKLLSPKDHKTLGVTSGGQPSLHHLTGYDAVHVTEEVQRRLFTYSTDTHRQNLITLQQNNFPMFWAAWRRDFEALEILIRKTNKEDLENWLASHDPRIRKGPLFRYKRLLFGTSLMSEFERLFEVYEWQHSNYEVTVEAVTSLMRFTSTTQDILAKGGPLSAYVASAVGHLRFNHPSMNRAVGSSSHDDLYNRLNTAVLHARVHPEIRTRPRKPFGEVPALHFMGIEQQYLPVVALFTFIQDCKSLGGDYFRRVKHDQSGLPRPEVDAIHLAAVIAANVNVKYAQAMLEYMGGERSQEEWPEEKILEFINNEKLRSEYENLIRSTHHGQCDPLTFAGDGSTKSYSSLIKAARVRMEMLPKLSTPGWTRWFHFQAWMRPDAEVNFLRKCLRGPQFDSNARRASIRREYKSSQKFVNGRGHSGFTGLPRINPFEKVHEVFKPVFDRIRYPELLAKRFTEFHRKDQDAVLSEVAKWLPAVTPIALDPFLNEQILSPGTDERAHMVVEAHWCVRRASKGRHFKAATKRSLKK